MTFATFLMIFSMVLQVVNGTYGHNLTLMNICIVPAVISQFGYDDIWGNEYSPVPLYIREQSIDAPCCDECSTDLTYHYPMTDYVRELRDRYADNAGIVLMLDRNDTVVGATGARYSSKLQGAVED